MIRPLDEALIDFEKTFRQTFKEPLYEHEQYTKRQLIYNYAAVGSQFISKTAIKQLKDNKPKPRDLEDIINQWNDPSIKPQHISSQPIKKAESPLSAEEQDQLRNFKKQVEVLKRQKMIVKNRQERSIFFRKQIEILFKTRNLNMLSVDSMRSHLCQLKPYLIYNSRSRLRKERNRERIQNRDNDEYRHNYGRNETSRQVNRRYDQRQDSRRNEERQSQRKSDYYGRQSQRKDDYRGDRQRSRASDEHRDYGRKRDSYERSQSFYPIKNTGNYYSPQQYNAQVTPYSVSQFNRNEIAYNNNIPTIEISSSHNQNYQPGSYDQSYEQRIIYPPPLQGSKSNSFYQYDSNANSQYGFRVLSNDSHKHYQDK